MLGIKRRLRVFFRKIGNVTFEELFETSHKAAAVNAVSQVQLLLHYKDMAKLGLALPSIKDVGYRVYSQCDEDGILLFIFGVIGMNSKIFVDIGSADGLNSNCANFAINFGWHGLFVDGDLRQIERGRKFYDTHPATWLYPPKFVCAKVKRSTVNELISNAGIQGEIDLLSIDIDGNDYWIWDALNCIQPRVVIIETRVEFGYHNIVVPYNENYVYPGTHPEYFGASPVAMATLADRLGYRLIGANLYGFNAIYIRKELAPNEFPTLSVEAILHHPRNEQRFKIFDAVKDMPYVEG